MQHGLASSHDVADAQRIQIRMPNVTIPSNMTDYYVCTAAKLPADRKYQVRTFTLRF